MTLTKRAATASARGSGRWRAQAVASATLAVLLVSGCGAGQQAQTSWDVPAIPGADADAGLISLRDLLIPYRAGGYPAGSDVPLVVRMFSNDEQPVTVSGVAPGPAGSMVAAAQRIGLRQPVAAAAGATESPTSLVVPPYAELALVPGSGSYLVAEHMTTPLTYGTVVPVRFTFSTGDSVDVDVPMAPPDYPVIGQAASPASGPVALAG
jgi:hypothetical protein